MKREDAATETTAIAQPNQTAKYWLILILAGAVWGVTFSLAKIVTEGGAHPIGLNFWQAIIGFVVLFAYVIVKKLRLPTTPRHLIFYTICGFLGTALPGTLFFFAARHVSAGVLSITLATVPIFTFALALLLRLEAPAFSRIIGIVMGIIAVLMIVAPETSLPDPSVLPWVLVALICAFSYTCENIYIAKSITVENNAFVILCGMMLTATFMTGGVALASNTFYVPLWPFTHIEWLTIAMAVINVFAYGSFIYLVTIAGPVFASQMAYLVTLSGVAWGIALFNEQHSPWIWASMVVMILGPGFRSAAEILN